MKHEPKVLPLVYVDDLTAIVSMCGEFHDNQELIPHCKMEASDISVGINMHHICIHTCT